MSLKIKAQGLDEIRRQTKRLEAQLRKLGGYVADVQARAVRDLVVRNAQPFGAGKKARQKGEAAVRGDLLRCMQPVPTPRRGVIESIAEAQRWHESRRNSRGRVRGGQRRPVLQPVFRDYLGKVLARVGAAKGSVAGGGSAQLGGRVQGWVKRWASLGSAKRRRSLGGAVWKFSADPPHVASSHVLGERGVKRILSRQDRAVKTGLEREVRAMLRKAGK